MIAGIQLGIVVEAIVSVLLLLTLGYCTILNQRLKRLHADKDALRIMITDLVSATTLAQRAIGELRTTASDCDFELGRRIEVAGEMQGQLALHVSAGQNVMERLAQITQAAKMPAKAPPKKAVAKPRATAASVRKSAPPVVSPVEASSPEADIAAQVAAQLEGAPGEEGSAKDKLKELFAKLESQRVRGEAA